MSNAEFGSIDDFLKYKSNEGGGGQKRLKDWKKDGQFTFWFHTACMPARVWLHKIPELVVRTDRETNVQKKNVWGRQHVCHEEETVLKKQKFTTSEKRREHPPKRCGVCRVTDGLRNMIVDGRIQDTQIVFKWTGSDKPEENVAIHAGCAVNWWKRDGLDDETKARLAAAGIYMSKAWMENMMAGLNFIFAVVNNGNPGDGVQVAVQNQLVGEKVKNLINDELASKPGDLGNPFTHPYAIQLVYSETEKKIDDKYRARRIDKYALTPDIEALIRGPKPDLSKFTTPFNPATVRAQLEEHATIDLPWDKWFPIGVPENETPPPVEPPPAAKTYSMPNTIPAAPAPPAEELGEPCECGAPMTKTQTKCGKCGAVYEIQPDPAPAATAPAAAPAPAAASQQFDGVDPNAVYDNDEIPF